MVDLKKVRVAWSGWPGAPGVSTFYFEGAGAPPLADLRTLFTSVGGIIATGIVLHFENTGVTIDSSTGKANGSWTTGTVADITGSGATAYAGPAGGMIDWRTGVFVNGRELRGKTYLVPLASNSYDTNGTIGNTTVAAMNTALANFVATGGTGLRVYSRTSAAFASVKSATMIDKTVVLRSRRS